jgi:hypothetical protein
LDLRQFIEDRDDSAWDLTMESPDPKVTLEGYILRVHHDVEIPDYVIAISVTDGRDTTRHDVTVHIVGVNDPPRINEIRFNYILIDDDDLNVTFREGEEDVLTVHATDEEWDPLIYSWVTNGEQIASGQKLSYRDLPTGRYKLTLLVDDGSDVTSVSVHVTVTEKELSVPYWQWAVVVIVILAVIAILVAKGPRGYDE